MRKSICLFSLLLFWQVAAADNAPVVPFVVPAVPALGVSSYLLMDTRSGQVLTSEEGNRRMAPGSTAKLMTAYVVFQELASGRIRLDTRFRVSKAAWKQGGASMFLKPGAEVTVNDLLQGLLVDGGNDAAVTLAQGIAGSRGAFVDIMNEDARYLGLDNTHYTDATGLPKPGLYTTALDLAKLSRTIVREFPQYGHYFTEKRFTWNRITQYNYDKLLWRDPRSLGLQPGYSGRAGGYCMASAARQGGTRLIAVVMGMKPQPGAALSGNLNALARVSETLLNYGFRFYSTHRLYRADTVLRRMPVQAGAERKVPLGLAHSLYVTIPSGEYASLKAAMDFDHGIQAPVAKGQDLGKLEVRLGHRKLTSAPVVALSADPRGNLIQRLQDLAIGWFRSKPA